MDKTTKTIIGIAAGIIVLCVCAAVGGFYLLKPRLAQIAEDLVIEDPAEVQAMAEEMAAYTLPPGYEENMGMNMFGVGQMAFFTASDNRPMISFFEINPTFAGSEEEMRAQMRQSFERQMNSRTSELTQTEERSITIAGEETTLSVYEGTDESGRAVRQWLTLFQGNNGPVLVMIMGSVDGWNEAELTAFLESIR